MKVPVLDTNRQPLAPCHPARARQLLREGKAAVLRRFPFTLILKEAKHEVVTPKLILKIDPGSKRTGVTLVNQETGEIVWAGVLGHRGQAIKDALESRRSLRRSRRSRKTRYRRPGFCSHKKWLNRIGHNGMNGPKIPNPGAITTGRPEGWLPPSIESRVFQTETWVKRLARSYPVAGIAYELVKFDMQLMQNPEISGVEYQQGALAGYEVREYLLERWGRACAYCTAEDVPLQIEHIIPKARGGTNRVSNLTLACEPCNLKKGTQTAAEFGFPDLQAQARKPLKDAAAVNATRNILLKRLASFGLPIETGSGGLTKYNRTKRGLPKTHWLDAACVGHSTPEKLTLPTQVLRIRAVGHGSRQICRTDKHGFPIAHRERERLSRLANGRHRAGRPPRQTDRHGPPHHPAAAFVSHQPSGRALQVPDPHSPQGRLRRSSHAVSSELPSRTPAYAIRARGKIQVFLTNFRGNRGQQHLRTLPRA